MDRQKYILWQCEERNRILREMWERPESVDKDIFNLKMILLDIAPFSRWWRWGYMRSLRRAIKALERENKEREVKKHD